MSITKKEVEHIAHLARIELTEAEKEKFGNDLSGILDFVNKLNEADTEKVLPLAGGTELKNVMREDMQTMPQNNLESAKSVIKTAELIKAAPEHENGFVKVKKVFE